MEGPLDVTRGVMNPDGLSPEALARLAKQGPGGGDLPLPDFSDAAAVIDWREAQHAGWGTDGAAGEVAHEPMTVAGVQCLVAGAEDSPVVVYLHGGGFCLGSPGTARPITARLASKLRIVSVDYRLAPEHPFPAGLDDAEAVYRELTRSGPVALAGDSAGGNLTLGVAHRCVDTPPVAIALFSPHLGFRSSSPSAQMRQLGDAYVATGSAADPLVSPLAATDAMIATLPPLLVQTTSGESLHSQAAELAARVIATGGDATLQVWHGLWHAWHYHRELPEAWHAVDTAGDWLSTKLI